MQKYKSRKDFILPTSNLTPSIFKTSTCMSMNHKICVKTHFYQFYNIIHGISSINLQYILQERVIFQYIDFYLFIMKIFQFSMKISIIRLEKRGGKVLLTHTNIISNFKCWNWCWNKTCFSAIRSLISSFWPAKKNSSFPRSSFYQNSVGTQFCSIKKSEMYMVHL